MSNLNFDVFYDGNRQDEVGELGHSINVLLEKLEDTISSLKSANNELQNDIKNVSELAPPRRADGVPGGPPSSALARGGQLRPPLTAIRLCTPPFRPATPPRQPLGWPPVRRARTHASSRQRSRAPGLGLRRNGWGT